MSTIKADTLSNVAGTYSISSERVARGTSAAWVSFDGTGTVAIRAAYNVSSITDLGTGTYSVNFTTAMPDNNYAISGIGTRESLPSADAILTLNATPTTSSAQVSIVGGGGGTQNSIYTCCAFFR